MRVLALLVLSVAAASAASFGGRIIGGTETSITNYPEMVSLLFAPDQINHKHDCGGIILNQRSVLTAAHCVVFHPHLPHMSRLRVGSDFANSGGSVYNVVHIELHPNYNIASMDSDLAVLRSATLIRYGTGIQPATLGGYTVDDNEVVWATGWGMTEHGEYSEHLRHVQVWTINQDICRARYPPGRITDNMLCSGWLDVGGRDQCQGDSGGPLYHHRAVVGVCSFGLGCALPRYPGVNVRVSRFIDWIRDNA
ncbi:trypsin, alkaline A-like [Anticarsia gemmatalis]|uniref:trypsin, alkaline A-like n=1 Tax=Anticarsia gemmatalis TaxID=129554 RepID=UPI003F75C9A6